MAGGGASALSSPWRALLQRALDGNAHLRHSTYFQLVSFNRLLLSSRIGENEIRSTVGFAAGHGGCQRMARESHRRVQVFREHAGFCPLPPPFFYLKFEFVIRGFQEHCDKIQINTDARSNKVCC